MRTWKTLFGLAAALFTCAGCSSQPASTTSGEADATTKSAPTRRPLERGRKSYPAVNPSAQMVAPTNF